jgi:NADH:ubiquinone oxidoreductase subunit 5 (subunit L)/multisubunit Na+/H+ antiporter MnhA subunit
MFLAVFAVGIGWPVSKWLGGGVPDVESLLEQARPVGTLADKHGELLAGIVMPDEHKSHEWAIKSVAGIAAITAALLGILFATMVYQWRTVSADSLRRLLRPLYDLSWHKWWFDELYDFLFVRPTLAVGAFVARLLDRGLIDGIIHAYAYGARVLALAVSILGDRAIIDNTVDTIAAKTWDAGLSLRAVQTGRLRQYVLFIVVGTIILFAAASLWWNLSFAR